MRKCPDSSKRRFEWEREDKSKAVSTAIRRLNSRSESLEEDVESVWIVERVDKDSSYVR